MFNRIKNSKWKIENFILLSVLAVFALSTFASSDVLGAAACVTIALTIFNFQFSILNSKANLWLLAYFMLVVVSLAGSTLFALSFAGFVKTAIYLGFYVSMVAYFKKNHCRIPVIMAAIGICAVSQSVIALGQNFAQVGEISTWQDVSNLNPEQVMTRVYGTLKPFNPNLLGGYLLCCVPVLLGLCVISRRNAMIWCAPALITIAALFATGCRGAYLGFAAVIAGVVVLAAKTQKKRFLSIAAVTIGAVTGAILCVEPLRARFASIFAMRQDSSNAFRFNVYQSAFEMFKDNWLLGIGVGNKNFREIYGLYMKTGFDALSAYNVFLEIAIESGVFALAAFIGFLVVTIKKALKSADIFVAAALISVCAAMVHGLVDTVFFRPQIQFLFWTMAAMINSAPRRTTIYPPN